MNTQSQPPAAGEAAHTPLILPLEVCSDSEGAIDICEAGAGDMVADLAGIDNAAEKAAFIVRACNSHAALVAALGQAESCIEDYADMSPEEIAGVLATISAALASDKS